MGGYQRIAIELFGPSIVGKSEEDVSGIVRELNIDNITAACNGGSKKLIRKDYVIAAGHKNRRFRKVAVCNIS